MSSSALPPRNAEQRFNDIVEQSMCIGCGICDSMSDSISVVPVVNGFERPVLTGPVEHRDIDAIYQVCPGTRVEGLPDHLVDKDSKEDPVWGVWKEMYMAYSAEPSVRHLGSTGGLLTGLALYLLESAQVDFILHAQASKTNPSFGEPCISHNREEVLNAAGSRYGPTATLRNVVQVLNQAAMDNQQFAFIGTPCDASALRNYATLDPRVDKHCQLMLTMVCGGFMAPGNMRSFIESQGIEYAQVASIRYRGYGCPGPTTIRTLDGESHQFTYLDFWGDDESHWGLPPRCKVCPDGIGDSADIAAADTWAGGSPTVEGSLTDPGCNAAVVRSQAGAELMNRAISAGYLLRADTLTPSDMNRFQPHQEAKKKAAWARFEGLGAAGNLVPSTRGLRLRRLYNENTDEFNLAEAAGAKRRAEEGKFTEPASQPVVKQR